MIKDVANLVFMRIEKSREI